MTRLAAPLVRRRILAVCIAAIAAMVMVLAIPGARPVFAQASSRQALPPPKPFPQPGQTSAPPATTTAPATNVPAQAPPAATPLAQPHAPGAPDAPSEATLGISWYPSAEFIGSYDGGRSQRIYLFGTDAPYVDVVAYYKAVMKNGGREIFKAPATQEFDFPNVKFLEDTMAFVPAVTVKDYTWGGRDGYLAVTGTTQKRYKTVIQIVPATGR